MDTFDTIMQYCPFLKEVIEGKIQQEAQERDTRITELEAEVAELKTKVAQ